MRFAQIFAATAALLLISAGAAMAETVSSGRIDLHYQDVSSDGADASVVGVTGAYAAPLSGDWGVQLDLTYDNVDVDGSGGDDDVVSGTAHVFTRNDSALYGVLAGAIDDDYSTTWGVGAEADFYGDNSTWGGRVLYLSNDDADVDFVGVDAHYRYFATDNLRLEVSGGYGQADSSGDDIDIVGIAGEAEYQFDSVPVSVFGGVSWASADSDFGDDEVTVATIGVRWNFGQDTLKSRDRSGASLKGINDVFGSSVGGFLGASSTTYVPPEEEYYAKQ